MPVRLILTEGTVADCSQAIPLIEGILAEHLLADKGYYSDEIVAAASAREPGDCAPKQPQEPPGL